MLTRRSWLVYGALVAIWASLIGWQVVEHVQVRRSARSELRGRAEDISSILAMIMRQQRFVVRRTYLETILNELVKQGELRSIVLLNTANEERAVAGSPVDPRLKDELLKQKNGPGGGEYWDDQTQTVALMNLVDMGTNVVLGPNDLPARNATNAPPAGDSTNASSVSIPTNAAGTNDLPIASNPVATPTNLSAGSNVTGTNAASTNAADEPGAAFQADSAAAG